MKQIQINNLDDLLQFVEEAASTETLIEVIKQALEGIKQGFKEAEELWGGELPEISYKTQERTIELIEKRLAELEGTSNNEENVEKSTED